MEAEAHSAAHLPGFETVAAGKQGGAAAVVVQAVEADCAISSEIPHSSNIGPSSSMDLSNELIINERVGPVGVLEGIETRTLTIPPQLTPSNGLLDAVD